MKKLSNLLLLAVAVLTLGWTHICSREASTAWELHVSSAVDENEQLAEKVRQYWPAANADGAETATAARPELLTAPCARWGVVTTIYEPNEAIVRASSLPSWCLVIIMAVSIKE